MLRTVSIGPEMGVDPLNPQPLGHLPDPLTIPASKAPQVSLEDAAKVLKAAEKRGFLKF